MKRIAGSMLAIMLAFSLAGCNPLLTGSWSENLSGKTPSSSLESGTEQDIPEGWKLVDWGVVTCYVPAEWEEDRDYNCVATDDILFDFICDEVAGAEQNKTWVYSVFQKE